jgi:hypothetical protein
MIRIGDPHSEGRATDAENIGPLLLIHALALKSRVNPELSQHRLWST